MSVSRAALLISLGAALSGCAELKALRDQGSSGAALQGSVFQAAVISGANIPDVPVQVFQVEKPVASPSLVEVPTTQTEARTAPVPLDPKEAVLSARQASTQSTDVQLFDRAKHNFLYFDNSVYQVYFSPGFLTTLYLQPGEELVNFFSGDTSRWSITQTHTGSENDQQTLILVKPHIADVKTNFVISTNKRVYLIDALATGETVYHTAVAWNYPTDNLNSLRPVLTGSTQRPQRSPAPQTITDPSRFSYNYEITLMEGDSPSWRPVAVFSDGQKTYIRFPEGLGAVDAPPLFIVGAEEENGLVNYRVDRNFYVIDHQIKQAILQHGDPRSVISIERVGG